MRVVFTGLPLFASKLAQQLQEVDPSNSYKFYNTYYSLVDKIKFFFAVLFCDVVVSCKGVPEKSLALSWVMFLRKKTVMQWQGTDVLKAIAVYKDVNVKKNKFIEGSIHITDDAELQLELLGVGINAELIQFKFIDIPADVNKERDMEVVSYVGKNNEAFYGMGQIIKLAEEYPEVKFNVLGTNGDGFKFPTNLVCHGWMDSIRLNEYLKRCKVLLRLTEHDGNSVNVMEALVNGMEVIWTKRKPYCHFAEAGNLDAVFEKAYQSGFDSQKYKSIVRYFEENNEKYKVLNNFVKKLKAFANS